MKRINLSDYNSNLGILIDVKHPLDYKEDPTPGSINIYADKLKKYVVDTVSLLHNALEEDKKILCEGAQATLLDIDFGSYPYVTSSNPSIGGICTGTGIGAKYIGEVYGVLKAYSSNEVSL